MARSKRASTNTKMEMAAAMGEHAIIEHMRKFFDQKPDIAVDFGDDVSAVPLTAEGNVVVLKADMLVADTDVPRGMNLRQAARKAVVMNASDFAAKGVQPQTVQVSLGLPRHLNRTDLTDLAKGLNAGARENGAYIVGGDTAEACDLIISVQLYGVAKKESLILRKGAKPGDILAITGLFGNSSAGLRLMLNKDLKTSKTSRHLLVDAVCQPKARLREGLALAKARAVSASIDSSDGLAWCLHELSLQSDVGFEVFTVPISKEAKQFADANTLDAVDLAFYGGEEYELVVTVKPEMWSKAESEVASVGGKLLPIGKATANKVITAIVGGKKFAVKAKGYEHFKT